MGRWLVGLLGVGVLAFALAPPPAPVVLAAPLAQATATATPTPTATATPTNTATPTPTLPPFLDFGNGYGVQPLPRANVNCIVDTSVLTGVFFTCTSGTPVPTP